MKNIYIRQCLLLFCCMIVFEAFAQIPKISSDFFQSKTAYRHAQVGEHYMLNVQFDRLPNTAQRAKLNAAGIELLEYQSNHNYVAKLPVRLLRQGSGHVSRNELKALGIVKVFEKDFRQKMSSALIEKAEVDWQADDLTKIEVVVIFHESVKEKKINGLFEEFDASLINDAQQEGRVRIVRVLERQLADLASNPIVSYLEPKPSQVVKLNHENRLVQKVNVLHASKAIGGKELTGQGVVIGVGDGGQLGEHIDFGSRVINQANGTYSAYGSHGDHVSGIIASAGNLNQRHTGIAPNCQVVTQKTTLITYKAREYYEDFGMVLTNNSYGVDYNCETNGSYNSTSLNLDQQLLELPEMLHVYAAGNSGSQTCDNYPKGFKSVLRYYAAAKNVLTVGAVDETRNIANLSSRGPVKDGRLKPEIVGTGMNVISTGRENNYFNSGGTSMASPSVTGTIALFYERFRQLNNGANPDGALMKAIACNTADDLGEKGPDYTYGFGLINGRRGVQCIENQNYRTNAVNPEETIQHKIQVPEGVAQLKVMLYWADKEGEVDTEKALIQNLDLEVLDAGGNAVLPWVLNPEASEVDKAAQRGVDQLNNIEQVTIATPNAGEYKINVKGTHLPIGEQKYFVVFDYIYPEVVLTHPFGNESFTPGRKESIQWDADITNEESFEIDYSEDNGQTWKSIVKGLESQTRNYLWTVPNTFSEKAKIRVRKSSSNEVAETSFAIMERPSGLSPQAYCDGYVKLNWQKADHAESYEVMMLEDGEMKVVNETQQNSLILEKALETGEQYWFAVRSKSASGVVSERTVATIYTPDSEETCPWDYDLRVTGVKVELKGRARTKQSLSNDHPVVIKLKNVGNNTIEQVDAAYSVNQSLTIQESVTSTINSGELKTYNFDNGVDMSKPGEYSIDTWLSVPNDSRNDNDTIWSVIQAIQLPNLAVELPYRQSFDDHKETVITESQIGLKDLQAWDTNLDNGEFSIINTGNNKYAALNAFDDDGKEGSSELVLTLNLGENELEDGLFISLRYYLEEEQTQPSVWIRGNDLDDWIPIVDLAEAKKWQRIKRLNAAELLKEANQNLGTSFQIKFTQVGEEKALSIDDLIIEASEQQPMHTEHFGLTRNKNEVKLDWEMIAQSANDYFEIQVAQDDPIHFETIGRREAQNIADYLYDYEFLDDTPNKRGKRYYRLKQVDKDGMFRYSELRSIAFDGVQFVEAFPNPFTSNVQLKVESMQSADADIYLFDAAGRLVQELKAELHAGSNQVSLDLREDLPKGQYFCKVKWGEAVENIKLIKW